MTRDGGDLDGVACQRDGLAVRRARPSSVVQMAQKAGPRGRPGMNVDQPVCFKTLDVAAEHPAFLLRPKSEIVHCPKP